MRREIVCAVDRRMEVISDERDEVGNGHRQTRIIACTTCQVCGGLAMVSHMSFLTGAVRLTNKPGSSVYRREASRMMDQNNTADRA